MRTDEMLAVEELHSTLRAENERLRAALTKIADPLTLEVGGIGMERALRTISTLQNIAKEAIDNEQIATGEQR